MQRNCGVGTSKFYMQRNRAERLSKPSGMRQTSTDRQNCVFKLNIVSKSNKIVVTVYEGVLQNVIDKHYKDITVKYLECGVKPAKIQYQQMNLREVPVSRKQIHSLQTRENQAEKAI